MYIKFWSNEDTYQIYDISKEKEKQKEIEKVIHIKNANIYLDDTVKLFTQKISVYMSKYLKVNENQIYLWYEQKFDGNKSVFINFINNVFKNDSYIDSSYFTECIQNYFLLNIVKNKQLINKNTALEILNKLKIESIICPIMFKYTNNGFFEYINYNPLVAAVQNVSVFSIESADTITLESLGIQESDTINIITTNFSDQSPVYFPFKDQTTENPESLAEFIKNLDNLHDTSVDISKYNALAYINFIHFRVNEFNLNKKINLLTIFDAIKLTSDIPYSKYKTKTNIYYKIYKPTIIKNEKNILEWSETNISTNKMLNIESVLFKIKYSDIYCSLVIYDNLVYDVKFNFNMKQKETLPKIYAFFNTINLLITEINKIHHIPFINQNAKIMQIVTVNNISMKDKKIKYENLHQTVINKLMYAFNIINNPDKNILHLQYKKVDDYTSYDNIQTYITNNYTQNTDNMIKKIMDTFTFSKYTAQKELEKWSLTNEEVQIQTKYKSNNFVNVKIKLDPSSPEFKFIVSGIKDYAIQERIVVLVKTLLELSKKKPKAQDQGQAQGQGSPESLELPEFEDPDLDQEMDADLLALEAEFLGEDSGSNSASASASASASTSVPASTSTAKITGEEDNIKGYILNKLYEADEKLFKYPLPPSKKRKDYASVCQWTARQQPIVVSQEEYNKINKEFPKALEGFVKTGTSEKKKEENLYVCPKIWCPISRVAINYSDYIKNGKKCPYPNIEEDPILFESKNFWGFGEAGLTRGHYPGFLDPFSHHPDKLCLPCCYKMEPKDGNRHKQRLDYCMPKKDAVVEDATGNEKYIKAANYIPLEMQRYGLLPKPLAELFDSKVCGNRHDGTGLINDKTDCILRKGINQNMQSFMSAMISVLDNDKITDIQSLIKVIHDTLTVQRYISLENGKLMKLFIMNTFDIFDKKSFTEFKEWFISQEDYIKLFTLVNISSELKKHKIYEKDMLYSKEILREFLIYNSYKHFKNYILDSNINKDHLVLFDLLTTDYENINIHGYNIAIIDASAEKFYIECPINRNIKNVINRNNPFVFIYKNTRYYEPIVSMKLLKHAANAVHLFNYKNPVIKNIITFYMDNCGASRKGKDDKNKTFSYIVESLGFKIKDYVIDYNFKCKGILLKENLYVPAPNSIELLEFGYNTKFIYISDVVKYKCGLSKDKIREIYGKLHEAFGNTYEIKNYMLNASNELIAFSLENTIVPTKLTHENILYKYFENDLDIFINLEKEDIRTLTMNIIDNENIEFQNLFYQIMESIDNDNIIKDELRFLLDSRNPFPKNFKREKILAILMKVQVQKDSKKNLEKVSEMILNNHNINFYILKHKFKVYPDEVIIDYTDLQNNMLVDIINYEKDPYLILHEKLDSYFEDYIFSTHELPGNLFENILLESTSEEVQVKWRKILGKSYSLSQITNYSNDYIYRLFSIVIKYLESKDIKPNTLKSIIQTYIISDYEKGKLDDFVANPSYLEHIKKLKITKPILEDYLTIFNSIVYYPSLYEIKILSKIIGITVFVTRRKSKTDDNINSIVQFKSGNKNNCILMSLSYNRHNNNDILELYIKDQKQVILAKKDLPETFWSILS